MISKTILEERVREWNLLEGVVEKDYVLGWVLWGIGSHPVLSSSWAFKGGTCLKKCYIETYRFSEDLDFTILPGGPILQSDVEPLLRELLNRVTEESGINFSRQEPVFKTHDSGFYTAGRVYYQGPRGAPQVASIKLDLSASEKVVRPTVLRSIAHSYPEELPSPATIRCYGFEEVFAEKIRAMGERSRPRDLYDIINLYRRADFQNQAALIRDVLVEKCQTKGVPVPTFESIQSSQFRLELESEWSNMLAHQLPTLPPFQTFWDELPALFDWLTGIRKPESLEAIPIGAEEESTDIWTPPPTIYAWGKGIPLETIRFAAANHLCINLGYNGTKRIIEPYSLRRTKDRNLILHAIKVSTRENRAYRVDRIQSIEVTSQPFTPTYKVEFSSSGPISAAPTTTRSSRLTQRRSGLTNRRSHRSGTVYIIECPYCQKRFRHSTRNTSLNRHKNKSGYACPGRRGVIVDVQY